MRFILFALSFVAFLAGSAVLASSKSAIHEIEGFMLFVVSAVCLSGAGIVEAITLLRKDLTSRS